MIKKAILLALLAVLAGCGAPPPTVSAMFGDYLTDTHVTGDEYRGDTAADRLAEFAAEGTRDQVLGRLFAPLRCETACELHDPVRKAADGGTVYVRKILVQHELGSRELLTVYVARKDGSAELVDGRGYAYADLEDFRRNNTILSPADWILAPRDITAVSGSTELVVLPGREVSYLTWILGIGGLVVVVATVGCLLFLPRRRKA